jgi:UDPglucose--hexose-1-phosphate uridylyltransferase
MNIKAREHPHRRLNQLNGEWVLVSPNRTQRPWLGQIEKDPPEDRPKYDPNCYLCPGNERAGGIRNPDYTSTFVFTNDFSALLPDVPEPEFPPAPIFSARRVLGTCQVICFSPRHDLTLPEMSIQEIQSVIDVWSEQTKELGEKYLWVQVFENKGAIMGSSNPHPHGQIWALDDLPNEPAKEDKQQKEYFTEHKTPLLLDYLNAELEDKSRVAVENNDWAAVVPFWAVWPFEILLLPKKHIPRLPDVNLKERVSLAKILKTLLTLYDNLFETSFPYSMGWHGAPFSDNSQYTPYWQLHAHFYPPLLRSATVKKFLVGFEMLAEAQRDLTAERAAERLRSLPKEHYKIHLS